MTANVPNSQMYNFTHMFDLPDLRGCLPYSIKKGTLFEALSKVDDFSMFFNLAILGNFDDILNSYQSNFTLFVPSDTIILNKYGRNIFEGFDIGDARNYLKASIVGNKITSELLENGTHLYTIDKITRLNIMRKDGSIQINGDINVVYNDILCRNGVIHVIDNKINLLGFSTS